MKYLLVYYSRSGYTRKAAEEIARHLDCDIEEIIEKKNRDGAVGYLVGIKDSVINKRVDIEPPQNDPAEYETVIIGTPVWANKPCLPVIEWMRQMGGQVAASAFFLTTRMSGVESTFEKMEELTDCKPLAALALKNAEMKETGWEKKAEEFAVNVGQQ